METRFIEPKKSKTKWFGWFFQVFHKNSTNSIVGERTNDLLIKQWKCVNENVKNIFARFLWWKTLKTAFYSTLQHITVFLQQTNKHYWIHRWQNCSKHCFSHILISSKSFIYFVFVDEHMNVRQNPWTRCKLDLSLNRWQSMENVL